MKSSTIQDIFARGSGILPLMPAFVTMRINQAGGRLKLHPDDWFPRGTQAGSVKERWLSSVLNPRGGSGEGLSFIHHEDWQSEPLSLPEAIDVLGAELIGEDYLSRYGTFPVHAKFFDYNQPLFLHMHLDETSAARIGMTGKPEAYYFPVQMNSHPGAMPVTYFGLSPDVTREEVCRRLMAWDQGDTHILELSRAYRLQPGTGWFTPACTLHAPGSLLTYEVQWNSTSGAIYENVLTTSGEIYDLKALMGACPPDRKGDWEYVLDLIDWQVNLDPHYREHYYRPGVEIPGEGGASERWIVYGNPYFSAKELTIQPGQSARMVDPLPYGCVVVQGHGRVGPHPAEAPILLRYGRPSADEFFVSAAAAREGVLFENYSQAEPLVVLKHFGPGYPDLP